MRQLSDAATSTKATGVLLLTSSMTYSFSLFAEQTIQLLVVVVVVVIAVAVIRYS